jgi:hypothetical protein
VPSHAVESEGGYIFSRPSWSRLFAAFWFVLLTCLLPRTAAAEAGRVVLLLSEAASSGQPLDIQLLAALRGQLQELDVEVLVVRKAQEPFASAARRAKEIASKERALGAIWLDLSPNGLSVFLFDSTGHLYARDLEPEGSLASQSEAIAIVLRSAIAALLDGSLVSMTEVQLPLPVASPGAEVPGAPLTQAAAGERANLRVGLSYVGTLLSRRTPWQHGAALMLIANAADSPWFFGLDYTQFTPLDLESNGVRMRLQRHPFEAFGGLQLRVAAVWFNVQAALSADYVARTTEQVSEGLLPMPDSGRWLWAISSRLGVTLPVSRRLSGVLNVGADFLLNPFHQVIAQTNSGNRVVASPLLARPRLELGATVSVW